VTLRGLPAYGALESWLWRAWWWSTLGLKFFGRGVLSTAAVLLGLLAGYGVAW
jgi:NCS2 family nucleobase:cation symporter-2